MTPPIHLMLVFHNHQPVGQFDYVVEHSTNVSYIPLIELLEHYPDVHVALHYSGPLLHYLKQHHGDLIERLRALVSRQQVEILSGGYYEPILPALPDEDKVGQIQRLSDEIRATFGVEPIGAWLAERVWEPHLPRALAEANIRYVILDDTHFASTGFDEDRDLFGYYLTEEQGYPVAVFPTLKHLRYTIPWGTIEDLFGWLRENAEPPLSSPTPRLALMSDDGEKFGTWPNTYEHCWGAGKYMDALFSSISAHAEWLKTITPGSFMGQFPAQGRAYLPSSSYDEMGMWSLPTDAAHEVNRLRHSIQERGQRDAAHYVRGGHWRHFMVKYDEINHMHKRMLMVSKKVHDMRRGKKRDRALDLLWAAQGNDPYWHGVYGGIYLFNARTANYASLLAAEEAAEDENGHLSLTRIDFDHDSHEDIVALGNPLNAIWSPVYGGALFELDFRPAHYNLFNVMTRRKEAYHAELVEAAADNTLVTPNSPHHPPDNPQVKVVRAKEPGLEKLLIYDWHRRGSFLDHFLSPATTHHEFYHGQYAEQGDFVNQRYDVLTAECVGAEATIELQRQGHVWIGEAHRPVTVSKLFRLRHGEAVLTARYTVQNNSEVYADLKFGVETVIGFDGGHDLQYCSLRVNDEPPRLPLNGVREFEAITSHAADSNIRNLTLRTELSRPAFLWQFPLETITLSMAGFERDYQGTVCLHVWSMRLAPGESWQVNITQSIQQAATR